MKRVFKIPDGKGGIRYRIQTPDGIWHDTDEEGNILSEAPTSREDENEDDSEVRSKRIPKGKAGARKAGASSTGDRHCVSFGIMMKYEDYRTLSDYVHWRGMFREECTKGGILVARAMEAIRRDKDFQEFRRRVLEKEP